MASERLKNAALVQPESPFAVLGKSADTAQKVRRISGSYVDMRIAPLSDTAAWSADFFGLGNTSAFRSLTQRQRHELLALAGRGILAEAQLIEIAGITYTAKMALLSETLEERVLYSFFAADEARHLQFFSGLIGEPQQKARAGNGFLNFLEEIITDETPMVLVLLIQVLLEGWGIRYYSSLARDSRVAQVTECFKAIVLDEGKHHGSGLVLFDESRLADSEAARLKDLVGAFISMVRMGPLSLVSQVSTSVGGLNGAGLKTFLEEVQFENKVTADLKLISQLLNMAGAAKIHAHFEAKGAFETPSLAECHEQIARTLGIAV